MNNTTSCNNIKIAGMQKLTLLDYPEKTAAILFLPGCNMRCPFCHNHELIDWSNRDYLTFDEIYKYLDMRKNILDGIVITGGEPSNQDIIPLLQSLRELGYQIKIDTNGLRPQIIQKWLDNNLIDYIAMDIKNSPAKYAETCGLPYINMDLIHQSINILMTSSIDYEFRTTVIPSFHTPDDFAIIGQTLIPNAKHFYLQPFVMRDTVPEKSLQEPSNDLLKQCLLAVSQYVKNAEIRGRSL